MPWASKASAPATRDPYSSLAAMGTTKLYLSGGHASGARTNTLYEYDLAGNSWATKATMPVALDAHMSAAIGTKLYVLGGQSNSGSSAALYEWDQGGNTWSTKSSFPSNYTGIMSFGQNSVAAVGTKLYAALFETTNNWSVLWVWDQGTDTWTSYGIPRTVRNVNVVAMSDGRIAVCGGQQWTGTTWVSNTDILIYSPATSQWSTLAASVNGQHYVPTGWCVTSWGGFFSPRYGSSLADVYNPTAGTWGTTLSGSIGTGGNLVASCNSRYFIFGDDGVLREWTPPTYTVTATAPSGTSSTGGPSLTVTWTYGGGENSDTQAAFRVEVLDSTLTTTYYDSGVVVSSGTSHVISDITATSIPGDSAAGALRVRVTCYSVIGASTTSSAVSFALQWGVVTATVTSPVAGQVLTGTSITPSWTFGSTRSKTQQKYRVRLLTGDGAVALYDSGWVTSSATSHAIPTALADGNFYKVGVQLMNTEGMKS